MRSFVGYYKRICNSLIVLYIMPIICTRKAKRHYYNYIFLGFTLYLLAQRHIAWERHIRKRRTKGSYICFFFMFSVGFLQYRVSIMFLFYYLFMNINGAYSQKHVLNRKLLRVSVVSEFRCSYFLRYKTFINFKKECWDLPRALHQFVTCYIKFLWDVNHM